LLTQSNAHCARVLAALRFNQHTTLMHVHLLTESAFGDAT
jgi:hypothetical protein